MKIMKLIAALLMVGYAAHAGSVTGKIAFDGTPPKQKTIKTDADPQCQAMHADNPLKSEEVVVNDNGTLRNVFVYVKSGVKGDYPCPKDPVVIDQKGCQYHPHVFGMHSKQLLLVKNSDDTTHNIHAIPNNSDNKELHNCQHARSAASKKTIEDTEA